MDGFCLGVRMRTLLRFVIAGYLTLSLGGKCRGDEFLAEPCEEPSICEEACRDQECCDCWSDCDRVLGLLPSDHCFDRFVSPLSNPFFFEDPRSLTEARAIFIDNVLPNAIGNGELQVWAAQLRGRISDRTSLIAPRLGSLDLKPGDTDSPQGFMSAPVGVKYNFFRDVDRQFLVSGGITYFIPGSKQAYSGFGDGDFHFFLTGGKQIFDFGHWLSATGFRIPCDNNWGTQLWYWSNQWDYEVARGLVRPGRRQLVSLDEQQRQRPDRTGHRRRPDQPARRGGRWAKPGERPGRREVEAQRKR